MGFIPSSKSTLGYRRLDPFDVISAIIAPILSLLIRDFDVFYSVSPAVIFIYIAVSALFSVLFFMCFHVGRGLPGYLSVHDAAQIAKATFCAVTSTTAFILFFTGIDGLPRSISIIHFFVLITMLSGRRLIQRKMVQRRGFRNANRVSHENEEHVFIVGAGSLASLYVRYPSHRTAARGKSSPFSTIIQICTGARSSGIRSWATFRNYRPCSTTSNSMGLRLAPLSSARRIANSPRKR